MFRRVGVKSDLFKSLQRCQHTSQISLHMADSIAGWLAGRALGSVGASSAGQIIEQPLIVCAELGEIYLRHYPALLCERLRCSRSLLWCLAVVVQLRWDRKRIGLLRLHEVTTSKQVAPTICFLILSHLRTLTLLPQTSPPPRRPNSRLEWQQRLLRLIKPLRAWSPFQRARNTSALFSQTLFWYIKSVREYMHFHLNPV